MHPKKSKFFILITTSFICIILITLFEISSKPTTNVLANSIINRMITPKEYIIIQPQEIVLHKSPSSFTGEGNFRLLTIISDDQGHSGGLFCPGTETIVVRKGDSVTPCATGISIEDNLIKDHLYIMMIAVNEKDKNKMINVSTTIISNLAARGLSKAIIAGLGLSEPLGVGVIIGLFALDTIISLAGDEVANYFQDEEVLGSQSFLVRRENNWNSGMTIKADADDNSVSFSFLVETSSSGQGIIIPELNLTKVVSGSNISTPYSSPKNSFSESLEIPNSNGNATGFLRSYYDMVSQHKCNMTWTGLTENFKSNYNKDGFGEYQDWCQGINKVEFICTNVIQEKNDKASVVIKIRYYKAGDVITNADPLRFELIKSNSNNNWMINDAYYVNSCY